MYTTCVITGGKTRRVYSILSNGCLFWLPVNLKIRSTIALKPSCVAVCIWSKVWRTVSENSAWFPSIMLREPLMSDNLLARLDWSDLSNFSWTYLSLLKIWRNSKAFDLICSLPFFAYRIPPNQSRSRNVLEEDRSTSFLCKHAKTARLIGLLPLSSLTINMIVENFFKPAVTTVSGLLSLTKKRRTETFLERTNNKFWEVWWSISLSE